MQLGQWCLLAGIIEVRILLSHRDWETEALSSGVLRCPQVLAGTNSKNFWQPFLRQAL